MALVKFTVAGDLPVRDAVTKQSVTKGNEVTLDDERTIIAALLESGAVKPLEAAKGKAKD